MNSIERFLKNKKNRAFLFFLLGAICLYFYTKNKAKAAELKEWDGGYLGTLANGRENGESTGSGTTPPPTPQDPPPIYIPTFSGAIGSFWQEGENTDYSFTKNRNFVVNFNDARQFTDNTPGLVWDGTKATINGKVRYYQINSIHFQDAEGNPVRMQNITLERGGYCIRAFDCNPATVTSYALFKENIDGWNQLAGAGNCNVHEISVTIHTNAPGLNAFPAHLKVSGKLEIPLDGEAEYYPDTFFSLQLANEGTTAPMYHRKGIITDLSFANGGPFTSRTLQAHGITDFYAAGRGSAELMQLTEDGILSTQFAEDSAPGKDAAFLRGMRDRYIEAGITDVKRMPQIGEYGLNNSGLSDEPTTTEAKTIEALTTRLYQHYFPGGEGWTGQEKPEFSEERYKYTNFNSKTYFGLKSHHVFWKAVWEIQSSNLALGTYKGEDNRRKLLGFTFPYYEDWPGIYSNKTVIKFPGGELENGGDWGHVDMGLMFRYSFIWSLISPGLNVWDAPNEVIGVDETKVNAFNSLANYRWKPNGSDVWQQYQPGVNGAPLNSESGIDYRMGSIAANAAYEGNRLARLIRKNAGDGFELCSYNSSLGNVVLTGGTNGNKINQMTGTLNQNGADLFRLKYRGIMLKGHGKLIYCNENISPHLVENVTAFGKNIPAYGGQVYVVDL